MIVYFYMPGVMIITHLSRHKSDALNHLKVNASSGGKCSLSPTPLASKSSSSANKLSTVYRTHKR